MSVSLVGFSTTSGRGVSVMMEGGFFFFFFCFNEGYNLLCYKVDYGNGVVENTMADFCFWFG